MCLSNYINKDFFIKKKMQRPDHRISRLPPNFFYSSDYKIIFLLPFFIHLDTTNMYDTMFYCKKSKLFLYKSDVQIIV